MSHLTPDDIQKLAQLSNLELTSDDIKDLPQQLAKSLDYVENLKDIQTDNVPASHFTTSAKNVMAEDIVDESIMLTSSTALKNASNKKGSYFIVKRIL
ncbi:hypothetical protein A3B02_01015 [Candidatus Roizmanbacteria bacterium RIFCSPLOWO2_01_FULL_42_14]|uniref:Aspartyl/glutamyl-tRNA(Asn/Gln) amidotransferase subunit C n=4 Tax=Candidatus Roizmaniibacteriota TaxID=1752723 RepID=A0A1F7JX99_9BACT|nr:MAG: hypothetical protein A3D08_02785 [Candidatus Roizmanbacteria bacterium RIFCSPHIGHO2_02_FULL_43_11]OGK38118.1 MAG: hypothetical protein A3F32_00085 [Candidatus Roizmanbacteria bacterium RIFCSPHIGHO2_12_FULL_42_10]OGK52570.1 MAG: hypothetical protein A3B02_01015 [Candidatus Roizmanbacteria bacterium RIFCSPLOWO2_01_FULL_42_14]OGK60241.1 MAG: hypothetical protein A3I56_01590 [Candidatus Roizmanbacteria bacterium RIFCSPLOWO2_02_FULL_43_10]